MLRTADLDYSLPEELIATAPAPERDAARLMVVWRSEPPRIEHAHVRDLTRFVPPRALMVFNTTRVLPARFLGRKAGLEGRVEGLYLSNEGPGRWIVLLKGRRLRAGTVIEVEQAGEPAGVRLSLLAPHAGEPGAWVVSVEPMGIESLALLERIGLPPLPPYILKERRRRHESIETPDDRERYQTAYAGSSAGSVAAPTAGLHFTPQLLEALAARGTRRTEVLLHVGTGTFRPVETEHVEEHPMHEEWCSMSPAAAEAVTSCRASGDPVVAIGTTSARTLESYAAMAATPGFPPASLSTRLLITPGYSWRWTDALFTNFHLPRSTLLALVAAMLPEGVPRVLSLYRTAIERRYRFFSYGDAMLILP